MAKIKLLVATLIVIIVASLSFNAYQYSTNLAVTTQNKKEEMATLLIHDAAAINSKLLTLDKLVSEACQQLTATGLTGSAAERVLSDLYTQNSDMIVNAEQQTKMTY